MRFDFAALMFWFLSPICLRLRDIARWPCPPPRPPPSHWHAARACAAAPQMEILARFFVGIDVNGRYCDEFRLIAWHYAMSPTGLAFDAVTSIPISWVDYVYSEVAPRSRRRGSPRVPLLRAPVWCARLYAVCGLHSMA